MKKLIITIPLFFMIISCNLKTTDDYFNEALEQAELKNYEEAIELLDKAIKKEPNFFVLYLNRGSYKAQLNQYKDSNSDYFKALELYPQNTMILQNIAFNYYHLDSLSKALEYYNQALNSEGVITTYIDSKTGRPFGINLTLDNEIDKGDFAINDYELYYNRGRLLIKMQKYKEAIFDFNKVIDKNIWIKESEYFKGKAFLGLGDSLNSCNSFLKSAKLGDEDSKKIYLENCK